MNTRQQTALSIAATCALLGYALWPSLQVGFTSDDALRSLREGIQHERGLDRAAYLRALNEELVRAGGRFAPVHFLLYTTTWVSRVDSHRLLSLALVMLAALLMAVLVRRLFGSTELAILSTALLPVLLQFRAYHDPILGFGGFIPGVLILNVLSLLALEAAGRTGRGRYYVLSGTAYVLALWSYELSYFIIPLHVLIAHRLGVLRRPAFLATVGVALCLGLVTTLYARHSGSADYAGTQVGELGARFWRTLVVQLAGALPFSYTWAASPETRAAVPSPVAVMIFVVGYLVVFSTIRGVQIADARGVLVFAAVLLIGPAIPVAASAKYQRELHLGLAYLPVFASVLGLALAGATVLVRARLNSVAKGALALLAALAAAWTHAENSATCQRIAAAFDWPRGVATRALQRGLFSATESGAGVIVGGTLALDSIQPGWNWYAWDQPAFFRMHAENQPEWVLRDGLVRLRGGTEQRWTSDWWQGASTRPMYFLQYEATQRSGRAMMAPVERSDTLDGLRTVGPTRLYLESANGAWRLIELDLVGSDPRQPSWFAAGTSL